MVDLARVYRRHKICDSCNSCCVWRVRGTCFILIIGYHHRRRTLHMLVTNPDQQGYVFRHSSRPRPPTEKWGLVQVWVQAKRWCRRETRHIIATNGSAQSLDCMWRKQAKTCSSTKHMCVDVRRDTRWIQYQSKHLILILLLFATLLLGCLWGCCGRIVCRTRHWRSETVEPLNSSLSIKSWRNLRRAKQKFCVCLFVAF